MAADPSAVWCMEKYGNWEPCRGKAGTFGVCRLPDGKLYEAWYIYLKETDIEAHLREYGVFEEADAVEEILDSGARLPTLTPDEVLQRLEKYAEVPEAG